MCCLIAVSRPTVVTTMAARELQAARACSRSAATDRERRSRSKPSGMSRNCARGQCRRCQELARDLRRDRDQTSVRRPSQRSMPRNTASRRAEISLEHVAVIGVHDPRARAPAVAL